MSQPFEGNIRLIVLHFSGKSRGFLIFWKDAGNAPIMESGFGWFYVLKLQNASTTGVQRHSCQFSSFSQKSITN